MKRITAILVSALVMLSMSATALAVPDDSDDQQSSQTAVSEQSEDGENSTSETQDESTAQESDTDSTEENDPQEGSQEESTDDASAQDESTDETSAESSSTQSETVSQVSTEESKTSAQLENSKEGSEISKPETVTPVEYRIEAAGMYISVPSDMYVITRDTDKDDPVLAQNRTTKEEITKTFEENDIYLRAYPKDFSFVVNVTVNSTEDTQAIGDLSALDEGELQSIADKLLESDVYTGCSRNRYGGALFLTFTIEYDSSGTKIEGLQEYTINDGKCVKITYQSAGDGDAAKNKQVFGSMMDSLRFDGIVVEKKTDQQEESYRPLTLWDVDIRYIYIIIASVLGIIALAVMMIAGIRYKRSKALEARRKAWEEAKKKRKVSVTFVDHDEDQKEIFSDTLKQKESENEKQRVEMKKSGKKDKESAKGKRADADSSPDLKDEADPSQGKPMTFEDVSGSEGGDGLDMFGRPLITSDELTLEADSAKEQAGLETTKVLDLPDNLNDEGLAEAAAQARNAYDDSGEPDDSKLFRAIEEAEHSDDTSRKEKKDEDDGVVFADHGEKRRTEIRQIDASSDQGSLTVAEIDPNSVIKPAAGVVQGSFFDRMVERIRETNAAVGQDITRMEKSGSNPILNPSEAADSEDMTNNEENQGDDAMNNDREYGYSRKSKENIELEISKSADGSLVIGALKESNGKPVDIEIRDASNFKDDRDREMAEMGFEVANENEIYNARREENAENPFVVRAKTEADGEIWQNGTDVSGNYGDSSDNAGAESAKKAAGRTASTEVKDVTFNGNSGAKQEKAPVEPAGAAFEGDSNITFEVAPVPKRQVIPMQSVFTTIPRLESVSAEDYNSHYEQMKKSMPRNHVYAQRFSASDVPQPFVENPRPITSTEPQYAADDNGGDQGEPVFAGEAGGSDSLSGQGKNDDGLFEYYTGYDAGEDPFADNGGEQEVLIRDHKKKSGSVGQRFRRSLGKLFSSEIPEDEE